MSSQISRLHQLTVGSDFLSASDLYPTVFYWQSALNQILSSQILVHSHHFMDSNSCSSLLGSSVCLSTLSATRTATHRTGIIQSINYQHSDGALHFYSLSIVTPDWLLTQSINTRSFVNRSTLDIVTSVLADYDFEWHLSEMLLSSESLQNPLSLRTQSDVSDWDFILGLLADSGVSTLWVSGDSIDDIGYLSLVSDFSELELLPLHYIYSQDSVQSGRDTVDELQPSVMQRGTRTVTVRADGLAADTIFEGSADDESALCINDTAVLIAAPSRVNSDEAATQLARQWIAANSCHREYYHATGAMRGMSVGSSVNIHDLPSIGSLSSYCLSAHTIGIEPNSDSVSYSHHALIKEWLQRVTKHDSYNQNHQHDLVSTDRTDIPSHAYGIARLTGIWVTAKLLEQSIPYCPYPSDLAFASSTYHGLTQARTGDTSTSITPSYAATVTDDNLQQTITTPVFSGISAHDDGVTPPLRSLQISSGATHGWQFAPRDGQPVLLTHWYGDIDSPVISRSIYDGIGMGDTDENDITTGSNELAHRHNTKGGSSPRWHGGGLAHSQINDDDSHQGWISGIAQYGLSHSSEVSFVFDDTPNKIGLQWSVNTGSQADAMTPISTSSATFAPNQHVLELGVLRHRFSNHQSTTSGQGFRLASDNSMQITGNQGVLLSSFGIRHSQSEHESAWVNDAGQRQLKIGEELSETLLDAKQAHLQSTTAIQNAKDVLAGFKDTAQIMDETLGTEVLGSPDVLVVSKDSILVSSNNTLWTATDIVRQSGSTQSDVVAGNYTLTADKIESLAGVGGQAALSGLHVSANREPLSVQAQGGELRLNSQLGMTIGSESGQVNLSSPKRIKLQTTGGASITIDESGVKLVCPGMIKIQAVKKSLVAGARANYSLPMMPETIPLFSNKLDVYDLFYHANFSEVDYVATLDDGQIVEGTLDEHGRTGRLISMESKNADVLVGYLDNWTLEYDNEDEEDYDHSNQLEEVEFGYSDEECNCQAPAEDINLLEDEE